MNQILFFPATPVDSSRDTVISCSNNGYDTLRLTDVRSVDPDFSVQDFTAEIPPDGSGWIKIRFRPSRVGNRTTRIIVAGNSINSPDTVNASGYGYIPGVPDRPREFFLSNGYPNPFNLTTRIIFGVPRTTRVESIIYS